MLVKNWINPNVETIEADDSIAEVLRDKGCNPSNDDRSEIALQP